MKYASLDADPAVQIDPLIRLWVLRMLIRLNAIADSFAGAIS